MDIMKEMMHAVSQYLLIPTLILLCALLLMSAAAIGGVIVEAITERRIVKENVSRLILNLDGRTREEMSVMIEKSAILKTHKAAIKVIIENYDKPEEVLVSASRRLIATEEDSLNKKAGRTETVARIGPMLGLMGTLIPLGPGLLALGQGDTKTLSDSLLIAFDTTIAGLAAAAICYVISKLRRRWYDDYLVTLETLMDTVLEEVISGRASKATEETTEFQTDFDKKTGNRVDEIIGERTDKLFEEIGIEMEADKT